MEKMGALELPASRVPGARATAVRLSILVCSRSDSTASDGQPEAKLAQAAEATPKIPYAIPLPLGGRGLRSARRGRRRTHALVMVTRVRHIPLSNRDIIINGFPM